MADFTALKTAIQNAIKQNGNEEITGNLLQDVLLAIVTTLGEGNINNLINSLDAEVTARQQAVSAEAQARQLADSTLQGGINTVSAAITAINNAIGNGCVYAGIATPSSTPASGKVFYLALTAGTYTNFNSLEVPQGINILKNNGSTWLLDSFLGIDDAPTPSSNKLVKSGGVFNDIMTNGSAFDLSAYNNGTTYADLSAALTALNALPAAYKKGGMSMKFVLSSDNKYVQWRLMADAFTTDITQWTSVEEELQDVYDILYSYQKTLLTAEEYKNGYYINLGGSIDGGGSMTNYRIALYEVTAGKRYKIVGREFGAICVAKSFTDSTLTTGLTNYLKHSQVSPFDVDSTITFYSSATILAVTENISMGAVKVYELNESEYTNNIEELQNGVSANAEYIDDLDERVLKLENEVEDIDNAVFTYQETLLNADDTKNGYYLNGAGVIDGGGSMTNYKLSLYNVTVGKKYRLAGKEWGNICVAKSYTDSTLATGVTEYIKHPQASSFEVDSVIKIAQGATVLAVTETINQGGIKVYEISDTERTNNIEELDERVTILEQTKKKKIVCWGDSLTWGSGGTDYPTIINGLQSVFDMINCGVGGENIPNIAARQGSNLIKLSNEITIPAGTTALNIGSSPFAFDYGDNNLLLQGQGRYINTVNPMDLGGIKVNLSLSEGNYYLTRVSAGIQRTFAAGTIIIPNGATLKKCDGNIYWGGTNGGSFGSLAILKERLDNMINYNGNDNYLILGLHKTSTVWNSPSDVVEINAYLENNYGNRFIDQLKYMVKYGIQDAIQLGLLSDDGTYPTAQDVEDMQNNIPPTSLRVDDTHYNTIGYTLIAHLVLDRMNALGMGN